MRSNHQSIVYSIVKQDQSRTKRDYSRPLFTFYLFQVNSLFRFPHLRFLFKFTLIIISKQSLFYEKEITVLEAKWFIQNLLIE